MKPHRRGRFCFAGKFLNYEPETDDNWIDRDGVLCNETGIYLRPSLLYRSVFSAIIDLRLQHGGPFFQRLRVKTRKSPTLMSGAFSDH